jgi:hypothetical protein
MFNQTEWSANVDKFLAEAGIVQTKEEAAPKVDPVVEFIGASLLGSELEQKDSVADLSPLVEEDFGGAVVAMVTNWGSDKSPELETIINKHDYLRFKDNLAVVDCSLLRKYKDVLEFVEYGGTFVAGNNKYKLTKNSEKFPPVPNETMVIYAGNLNTKPVNVSGSTYIKLAKAHAVVTNIERTNATGQNKTFKMTDSGISEVVVKK